MHQVVAALGGDTFAANGSNTRFVFHRGVGDETIDGFKVSGPAHDRVSLPNSDSGRLAQILAQAQDDGLGDTTIKLGHGDTLTFAGVSGAALQKHAADFVSHE